MTTPKHLKLVGKIVFAVPFIVFGVNHLMKATQLKGLVPTYLPADTFWVYVTGVVFIVSALGILTGKWAKESSWALAIQLALLAVLVQLPMALKGNYGNFLKDIALAGGALMLAGIMGCDEDESNEGCCGGGCGSHEHTM